MRLNSVQGTRYGIDFFTIILGVIKRATLGHQPNQSTRYNKNKHKNLCRVCIAAIEMARL